MATYTHSSRKSSFGSDRQVRSKPVPSKTTDRTPQNSRTAIQPKLDAVLAQPWGAMVHNVQRTKASQQNRGEANGSIVQRKIQAPNPKDSVQLEGQSNHLVFQQAAHIHQIAQQGIAGNGGALPHAQRIQASFGRHNINHLTAHTDHRAQAATRAINADAYATGSSIAFANPTPDLHTAAHEAAHAIQQQSGVQLKGGVGGINDRHERHADAVADRVVAGQSAESLLNQYSPSSRDSGLEPQSPGTVQGKFQGPPNNSYYQDDKTAPEYQGFAQEFNAETPNLENKLWELAIHIYEAEINYDPEQEYVEGSKNDPGCQGIYKRLLKRAQDTNTHDWSATETYATNILWLPDDEPFEFDEPLLVNEDNEPSMDSVLQNFFEGIENVSYVPMGTVRRTDFNQQDWVMTSNEFSYCMFVVITNNSGQILIASHVTPGKQVLSGDQIKFLLKEQKFYSQNYDNLTACVIAVDFDNHRETLKQLDNLGMHVQKVNIAQFVQDSTSSSMPQWGVAVGPNRIVVVNRGFAEAKMTDPETYTTASMGQSADGEVHYYDLQGNLQSIQTTMSSRRALRSQRSMHRMKSRKSSKRLGKKQSTPKT